MLHGATVVEQQGLSDFQCTTVSSGNSIIGTVAHFDVMNDRFRGAWQRWQQRGGRCKLCLRQPRRWLEGPPVYQYQEIRLHETSRWGNWFLIMLMLWRRRKSRKRTVQRNRLQVTDKWQHQLGHKNQNQKINFSSISLHGQFTATGHRQFTATRHTQFTATRRRQFTATRHRQITATDTSQQQTTDDSQQQVTGTLQQQITRTHSNRHRQLVFATDN